MRCNEKFHEIIKNETEEQYCPICSQNMEFNDECQIVYLKEYDVCCDCQDMIRNFGKFVCRSCGIVQGYEPAREFIDFYDNRHRIRRKSVYHRKYHINDILMRISMNHKIEISVANKTKIMRIFNDKINQLIAYKHLLTNKQKRDILNSVQSGGKLVLKPTKSQYGGFLGTLLASIGIPLAVEAIKKITGGAPRMGSDHIQGNGSPRIGMYQPPPPFVGTWEQARKGGGKKKKKKKKKKIGRWIVAGQKQSIQKSPSLKHSILKPPFNKKIPMSNYDLLKWCEYLNIPIRRFVKR